MTRTEKAVKERKGIYSSLSLWYWKILVSDTWVRQIYVTYTEHKNFKCCFIEENMCLCISQAHFLLKWILYDEYLLNFLNLSHTLWIKCREVEGVDFLGLQVRCYNFNTVFIRNKQNAPVCPCSSSCWHRQQVNMSCFLCFCELLICGILLFVICNVCERMGQSLRSLFSIFPRVDGSAWQRLSNVSTSELFRIFQRLNRNSSTWMNY